MRTAALAVTGCGLSAEAFLLSRQQMREPTQAECTTKLQAILTAFPSVTITDAISGADGDITALYTSIDSADNLKGDKQKLNNGVPLCTDLKAACGDDGATGPDGNVNVGPVATAKTIDAAAGKKLAKKLLGNNGDCARAQTAADTPEPKNTPDPKKCAAALKDFKADAKKCADYCKEDAAASFIQMFVDGETKTGETKAAADTTSTDKKTKSYTCTLPAQKGDCVGVTAAAMKEKVEGETDDAASKARATAIATIENKDDTGCDKLMQKGSEDGSSGSA